MLAAHFELFDDRPSSCDNLSEKIVNRGIDVVEEKTARKFAKKLRTISEYNTEELTTPLICGYGIDNHIANLTSLAAFGKKDIKFDDAMAGWEVVSKILIPGIISNIYPAAPIAMISGQPLDVPMLEFEKNFKDVYPSVYFFRKQDFANDNSNVLRFIDEVEECKRKRLIDEPTEEQKIKALKFMLNVSSRRLALTESDLTSIFKLTAPLLGDDLLGRLCASTTTDWQDKVNLLFRLTNSLTRVYIETPKGSKRDAAIANCIRINNWPSLNSSIYELLIDGRPASIDLALDVVLAPGGH